MKENKKHIGVVGAGWIGMDWVNRLFSESYSVRYTKRSIEQLQSEQLHPFSFGEKLPNLFCEKLDFLFITATIPKEQETCLDFIEQLKQHLSSNCTIVFTSTIGVYSTENGVVDEESPELKKKSAYYQFEKLLLTSFSDQTIILRLGGLIGEDRHPVFSLSGRKDISDGQKVVNLIHKEDIFCFFQCILRKSVPKGIYNLVYPEHPPRREYYAAKAKEYNLEIPEFIEGTVCGKIVCSEKSRQIVGFDYHFPI